MLRVSPDKDQTSLRTSHDLTSLQQKGQDGREQVTAEVRGQMSRTAAVSEVSAKMMRLRHGHALDWSVRVQQARCDSS